MREIAAAVEWRLLALLFERPRPGWHEEVEALGCEVADDRLRAAASAAGDANEGEYLALLGPGGAASPRAVSYVRFSDPARTLSEIAAHHEAFGFHPRAEDPLDHVAVLCDFVAYLVLKQAYARARSDGEAAAVAAAAQRHIEEAHLAPLAGPLTERLESVTDAYLVDAAALLRARVPPAPPFVLGPAGDELDGGCGACG